MGNSEEQIAESIETYVRTRFHIMQNDFNFTWEANLYDGGYIDSVGVLELIAFIESTVGVELQEEHLFSDEFTSIAGISKIVYDVLNERTTGERTTGFHQPVEARAAFSHANPVG